MNVNSLSNISNAYSQSLINSTTGGSSNVASSSFTPPQDGNPQLSPLAQAVSQLQQIQQQNPTEYQQVTQQIATNLQTAAQTAQADGNTTQANQLTQLSNTFQNASQSGQIPSAQQLQQAASGHHHHHHHGGSGGSGGAGGSASSLSQLFTDSESNTTQSESLNPFSIILNTIGSAGTSGQTA